MDKPLHQFFENDHEQIDELLRKATAPEDGFNLEYYYEFRARLLRHIKMEEKVLFPAARNIDPDLMQDLLPKYRSEHGAITSLMVPPPTASLIKVIRYVLECHNDAEERPGGLYDVCEALTRDQAQELLEELKNTAKVPMHLPNPAPIALEAAKRALARANYDYDEIVNL